jgi:hypothetical protein
MEVLAAAVCAAVAVAGGVALLGMNCARGGTSGGEVLDPRAAEPLLARMGAPPAPPTRADAASSSSADSAVAVAVGGARAGATRDAPKFSKRVEARGAGAEAAAPSAIFCRCGGPGTLVRLQPCGHPALCMTCAQLEKACPTCGEGIEDSVPSFRAAADGDDA